MSTKIYNAYKFNGSMKEFVADIKEMKQKIVSERCVMLYPLLRSTKTEYKDAFEKCGIYGWDLSESFCDFVAGHSKDDKEYASVVSFPDDGAVYCMFFGMRGYEQYLSDRFEDFHYQNQTDRPEDISEEDWEARKHKWDEVMPTGTPAEDGLTMEIFRSMEIRMEFSRLYEEEMRKNKSESAE